MSKKSSMLATRSAPDGRKCAETALSQSESRFRTLCEASLGGIYIVQDGCIRYANPALARMLACEPDELNGVSPLAFVHPDDRALVEENLHRRLSGEAETSRYEARFLRKDGKAVPVEVLGSRIDYGGQRALIGTFLDITDRKRADEALRAALAENEKLRNRLEQENQYLREQAVLMHEHRRIIGQSDALRRVLSEAERVAVTDTPVLLFGETGTGKELLAQTIHELSPRRNRPMVIVNCASLPATLIESELFGREAGAYTGAASSQVGRFVVADRSTLFLDEIGEFPVELQAKLLRVLQDGRFERLGSPETVKVNVRIVAATNRDLGQAVREGRFRADLYHRLNVFPIHVPPLRERRDDIPLLAWAFVEAIGRRMGKTIKKIPRRTIEQLQRYGWPGNVRELSNVIERAMILTTGDTLRVQLPFAAQIAEGPRMTLKASERAQILRVLDETGWRIRGVGGAAEILGLKPTTLEARMAKLGIKREKRSSNIS